jgi:hypothetical protein
MIVLAFSGTQPRKDLDGLGMTAVQRAVVANLLVEIHPDAVRHGDCVGSDAEFAELVHDLFACPQVVHPGFPPGRPADFSRRAYVNRRWPNEVEVLPSMEFLKRNEHMVQACSHFLATPGQMKEIDRSGTWSTVRKARHYARPRWIVYPDGSIGE